MPRAKLVIPRDAIERYMLTSPLVYASLFAQGNEAAEFWRSVAPVGKPEDGDKNPGAYKDSIRVIMMRTATRQKVRVYTKDKKAHWIEYGAKSMPKYAPMAKTRAHMIARGARAIDPAKVD